MSGTSLDGVDLAYCVFHQIDGVWSFHIPFAETYSYSKEWVNTLGLLQNCDASTFAETNIRYGMFLGSITAAFIKKNQLKPLLIASHGHTIFHKPDKKITVQIGSGASISTETKCIVINDFRSQNVALNGQGAPLVPIGDKLLFSDFSSCINLGGFANVSYEISGKRVAFDISPFNIVLNEIFQNEHPLSNIAFDTGGCFASTGSVNSILLEKLNALDFYLKPLPKSLGREWLEEQFLPILKTTSLSNRDKMRTVAEHIAIQISKVIIESGLTGKVLMTGGGVYNSFIISRIKELCPDHQIIIPEKKIIDFKEALIFAFLGL
ncbi:MAG: anhydro-N-acetylmuramic acid kinase, partial [Bacteroidales bacterium]|nr:anhydro-N-acetylmuramic acid kinase [Bacteroidales bacterium]